MRIPRTLLIPAALLLLFAPSRTVLAQPVKSMTPAEVRAIIDNLPPGYGIELESVTSSKSGKASGTSGDAAGDGTSLNIDGSAPTLSLDGTGSGVGGGGKAAGWANLAGDKGVRLMAFILGALCLAGAAASVAMKWGIPRLPIALGVLGLGLIACGFYPALLLWALGLAALAMLAHLLLAEKGGTRTLEALRAVTAGVNDLPPETRHTAQKAIRKHADKADKATIRRIKEIDDLRADSDN